MKTKIKKKIQKATLPSVADIITKTYKRTPAVAKQIIDSVNKWAADRGLTSIIPVIYAMLEQENGFDPAGSDGLMQVTKTAIKQVVACYGFDASGNVGDIDANIHCGIYYLHHCLCDSGGSVMPAVKAYNGGGDANYISNVGKHLSNYTTDSALIGAFHNGKAYKVPEGIQGCAGIWLQQDKLTSLKANPSAADKGDSAVTGVWTGTNPFDVDIFQLVVKFRFGKITKEVNVPTIKANSKQSIKTTINIGAVTKADQHTLTATVRAVDSSCGSGSKTVKATFTVKEEKKTVLLRRKDGVEEHYHVSNNDPKYAAEFGIPVDTTWA